jgi:hypothetical protein
MYATPFGGLSFLSAAILMCRIQIMPPCCTPSRPADCVNAGRNYYEEGKGLHGAGLLRMHALADRVGHGSLRLAVVLGPPASIEGMGGEG